MRETVGIHFSKGILCADYDHVIEDALKCIIFRQNEYPLYEERIMECLYSYILEPTSRRLF